LITNHPQKAKDFVKNFGTGATVYKAFSATEQHWRETRILRQDEMVLIENVKYAPVIFQEYIPAKVDLRITIIGECIFAAEIYSQDTAYKADYRMDMNSAKVKPHTLPADLCEQLLKYMQNLHLVYGAIDMRLTPDDEYVFLEINPTGQWLFIEERTGQPITETLAELMVKKDRSFISDLLPAAARW
jgi:glutathione synthase/RimK-type ligase-like ATP-grasp enzyme